jgi:hypothetical protein
MPKLTLRAKDLVMGVVRGRCPGQYEEQKHFFILVKVRLSVTDGM